MSSKDDNWNARIGRRIRLRDVHVFLTVVQCGSMAKAAQQLSVTQPAISKSVADLESALGVRLLDRGPQGVAPTDYGKAFERRGFAVFDELRQGVSEIECMADPRVGEARGLASDPKKPFSNSANLAANPEACLWYVDAKGARNSRLHASFAGKTAIRLEAWFARYYTDEHVEKIMRRAVAGGLQTSKLVTLCTSKYPRFGKWNS